MNRLPPEYARVVRQLQEIQEDLDLLHEAARFQYNNVEDLQKKAIARNMKACLFHCWSAIDGAVEDLVEGQKLWEQL